MHLWTHIVDFFRPRTITQMRKTDLDEAERELYKARLAAVSANWNVKFYEARIAELTRGGGDAKR